MDPVEFSVRSHRQRPRFSLDARNVPWTDGVGEQVEYAKAVSP